MPNQCVTPYEVTETVVALVLVISTMVGFVCTLDTISVSLRSEKMNGVKTMYTFWAMENNSLSIDPVIRNISVECALCMPREALEVKNIFYDYEHLLGVKPYSNKDLWKTHAVLMFGADAFCSRGKNDLLTWVRDGTIHPLIKAGYETFPANDLMSGVGLSHREIFQENYLQPVIDLGLVNRRCQKYSKIQYGTRKEEQYGQGA